MWARVSSYEMGSDAKLEEGVRGFEGTLDTMRQTEGVQQVYLLVDRTSGKALTVTLWESEDAMRASEETADRLRREVAGDTLRDVARYEVAVHEDLTKR